MCIALAGRSEQCLSAHDFQTFMINVSGPPRSPLTLNRTEPIDASFVRAARVWCC
jgi:hypothetical protein